MDATTDLRKLDSALIPAANAADLEEDLDWFAKVLDTRLRAYLRNGDEDPLSLPPPDLAASRSTYATFLRSQEIQSRERLLLLLALIPHLRPQLLDVLWIANPDTNRGFSEFGGVQGNQHGSFLPTGETAAFLLAGDDLNARFAIQRLFDGNSVLVRSGAISFDRVSTTEVPYLGGLLSACRDFVDHVTSGQRHSPSFGAEFPAQRVESSLEWDDLVLTPATRSKLQEIQSWIDHGDTLLDTWGMRARLRPGFTSLFHGPPGTGKTLSASILGKRCGCDVYRVDLSMIVSKYVGETEKNLARVFAMAEHRRWILFFDEADALFGKRTKVEGSHDRFANQEVSYLLQRIEQYAGIVILASNLKSNIDDAFLRRLDSVVQFPVPRSAERLRIWREALPAQAELESGTDLERLARDHTMAAGTILNVIRHAALMALNRGGNTLFIEDIREGIRREGVKEGRAL